MGWPQCNSTLENEPIDETSLFASHQFSFHHFAEFVAAAFGIVAVIVSFTMMFLHATHYCRPKEQRHIIRILFMVPIYATVSFLSIVFYTHSVYYEVLRDCYEAFAIASFFSLMCAYLADDIKSQKEYFRKIKPKPWIWPMPWFQKCAGGETGWLRTPRSGLTWFNVIFVAVFQYCFIRVTMTITAVISQHFRRYCLESLNPAFAHVWVMVIEAIAVSITMYCIIQFYIQIRGDVAQHKPFLKVLSIKLVIFLSFWQTIIISFLTSSGAIKASDRIQTPDIKVGIPALLLCIEMALFSILHIWSFSWRPYAIGSREFQQTFGHLKDAPTHYVGGPLGIKAALDCFNPLDILRSVGRAFRWLFVGRKKRMQDISYADVPEAQKLNDLEHSTAFGAVNGSEHASKISNSSEGAGLLSANQTNSPTSKHNPFVTQDTSSASSPWAQIEAKEYFQDQQMRKQEAERDDGFESNPYDAKYMETQSYTSQRPAPVSQRPPNYSMPQPHDPATGRQNLPFVTQQDLQGMPQGSIPPYPSSRESIIRAQDAKGTYTISNQESSSGLQSQPYRGAGG